MPAAQLGCSKHVVGTCCWFLAKPAGRNAWSKSPHGLRNLGSASPVVLLCTHTVLLRRAKPLPEAGGRQSKQLQQATRQGGRAKDSKNPDRMTRRALSVDNRTTTYTQPNAYEARLLSWNAPQAQRRGMLGEGDRGRPIKTKRKAGKGQDWTKRRQESDKIENKDSGADSIPRDDGDTHDRGAAQHT